MINMYDTYLHVYICIHVCMSRKDIYICVVTAPGSVNNASDTSAFITRFVFTRGCGCKCRDHHLWKTIISGVVRGPFGGSFGLPFTAADCPHPQLTLLTCILSPIRICEKLHPFFGMRWLL